MASRPVHAIIAAVSVVAVLAACGGQAGTSVPSASPAASSAATTSPGAAPSASPTGPLALRSGSLGAGTYTTTRFEPTVTFTLGEGWMGQFQDDEDEVALDHSGTFLGMTRPTKVIDPVSGGFADAPEDVASWLSTNAWLTTTAPEPVEVAGRKAVALEVTPAPGEEDAPLFYFATGAFHIPSGNRARFIVLPMDGPDLVIAVLDKTADFPAALDLTAPVLASLAISP